MASSFVRACPQASPVPAVAAPVAVAAPRNAFDHQIDHPRALTFGTASAGGTGTPLFSAGINDEQDGLIGAINPAP